METNNCECGCKCDPSQINLDITIRQAMEKCGINPEAAQKCLKDCCKNCCQK